MEKAYDVSVYGVMTGEGEYFPEEEDTVYLSFVDRNTGTLLYLKMHVTDSMALLKNLLQMSADKGFDYLWKD